MRKTIVTLSCCIGLLLFGYTSFRGYQVWKENHWLTMARGYATKGDLRNTFLSLRQVLNMNPRNINACRMMAGLTEAARSHESLVWRQRVLELNPKSFQDRLSLAQTAIIFQDYALATNTLAGLGDADKKTAEYHNIAGAVAFEGGQLGEAEIHFSESVRLDPSNPIPEVNLAVVRLHGTNALDMAEARVQLQRISMTTTNMNLRSQARRELIVDALRFNDKPTVLTLSKELVQQTNSLFADKLLRLDVLLKTQSIEFKPALASYQREASTDPSKLLDLVNWQNSRLSSGVTLGWLQSLPPETRTNQPAALLAAECQLKLNDWLGLQTFLQPQNWNELEFMRHALLARSLREQNLTEASATEWAVALKYAGHQKSSLVSLFQLAAAWKWNTEAEQILWTVVNQYPEEKWAPPVLSQALMAWHRTRSLMELFSIMSKRDPNDWNIKNNLAMTAMLLGAQEINYYNLAQEVYEKEPKNPFGASTYAFSLYQQKRYTEALQVMQHLSQNDLKQPSIAGYYGMILKAQGNKALAKTYLNWTSKAKLLPEEQTLFEQAKSGL